LKGVRWVTCVCATCCGSERRGNSPCCGRSAIPDRQARSHAGTHATIGVAHEPLNRATHTFPRGMSSTAPERRPPVRILAVNTSRTHNADALAHTLQHEPSHRPRRAERSHGTPAARSDARHTPRAESVHKKRKRKTNQETEPARDAPPWRRAAAGAQKERRSAGGAHAIFQTMIVPSSPTETMRWPSGENLARVMPPEWPRPSLKHAPSS
jgi:hypothetical protein